jgi:hypothetical protein
MELDIGRAKAETGGELRNEVIGVVFVLIARHVEDRG